ncbi:hypothetical protein PRNP1_008837 [Phytophthora ramorum]
MEAASIYPNWPPVLAATGLGVTLAAIDPDRVPLQPVLINDPRTRFAPGGSAVDASGVMRLHVRNTLGYTFLRPHHTEKLRLRYANAKSEKRLNRQSQAAFYRRHYRPFVPHDLMMDFLENECPQQENAHNLSKWQGNAVAGVDQGQDGHVVFYPTGQVLQQACAWYSKGESEGDAPCSSTVIETGAPIRQFVVLGNKDAYHSASAAKIFAAARGSTNCTIVAAPARIMPANMHKMQAKAKISFPTMIKHIAGSPHAEAEVAFVSSDGVIRCWDPEGGVQNVYKGHGSMSDRILRCEYSSHPRVLWAVKRAAVSTLDLRQPPQHSKTLFDVGTYISIYDVKRRASNPFQFVVGTGISIELLDSRMACQPLISWPQPQSYSGKSASSFGAIDEVNLSRSENDERGYVVSSFARHKVTTLFPFEKNRKRKRSKMLSLASLRSNEDDEFSDIPRSNTDQLVASDATLDLHLEDGGEYTNLTGLSALREEDSSSATIYQLNSLGDLYSHRVAFSRSQTKSYRAAVQPDLPCGITAQDDSTDESLAKTLPIPLDAILPEHDTESMQTFFTLPVKVLRRQFPRLPELRKPPVSEKAEPEASIAASRSRSFSYDEDDLVEKLLRACDPSASLYRLLRLVNEELRIVLSSPELLELIRSRNQFRIRTVQHAFPADTLRVRDPSSPDADSVHCYHGDPRLVTCTCRPGSPRSQMPCESWSCVVPHAVIVSSASRELHLDDTAPSSAIRQEMSEEFANVLAEARTAYDEMYEFEPE